MGNSKALHSRERGARVAAAGRWLKLPHLLHVYTKLYQYFMRIYTSHRTICILLSKKLSTLRNIIKQILTILKTSLDTAWDNVWVVRLSSANLVVLWVCFPRGTSICVFTNGCAEFGCIWSVFVYHIYLTDTGETVSNTVSSYYIYYTDRTKNEKFYI